MPSANSSRYRDVQGLPHPYLSTCLLSCTNILFYHVVSRGGFGVPLPSLFSSVLHGFPSFSKGNILIETVVCPIYPLLLREQCVLVAEPTSKSPQAVCDAGELVLLQLQEFHSLYLKCVEPNSLIVFSASHSSPEAIFYLCLVPSTCILSCSRTLPSFDHTTQILSVLVL